MRQMALLTRGTSVQHLTNHQSTFRPTHVALTAVVASYCTPWVPLTAAHINGPKRRIDSRQSNPPTVRHPAENQATRPARPKSLSRRNVCHAQYDQTPCRPTKSTRRPWLIPMVRLLGLLRLQRARVCGIRGYPEGVYGCACMFWNYRRAFLRGTRRP